LYTPVWSAIVTLLSQAFAPSDAAKFATFGLFDDNIAIPVELLAVAWRLHSSPSSRSRCGAVIAAFEAASLLKRVRDDCVLLHDLSLDLARALLRPPSHTSIAHQRFLDRAAAALLNEPQDGQACPSTSTAAWWLARRGTSDAALNYLARHLLQHFRAAGWGSHAKGLCFRLPWLQEVRCRAGVDGLAASLAAQHTWAKTAEPHTAEELGLLLQAVKLSTAPLRRQGSADALPSQLVARLQRVCNGVQHPNLTALVSEGSSWLARRGPFIRPRARRLHGSAFGCVQEAGGACEAVLAGHARPVTCLCVVPASASQLALAEDSLVMSGSMAPENALCLWDAGSGECLRSMRGHRGSVTCLCTLRSGRVISGSADGELRIWDTASGECMYTIADHEGKVFCLLSVAEAEGTVASAGSDGHVRVWDCSATPPRCISDLVGHTMSVSCLTMVGRALVSGSLDSTLRVWQGDSVPGMACALHLLGHTKRVNAVIPLPLDRLASASGDKDVRIWSAVDGGC
jgi:hypothetical protein